MHKLVIGAGFALSASLVHAQPPSPTGLVVASGNFYSPIVASLEEAVRFYRDGLGFEFAGEPGNADSNPELRTMFGLPDARLRWHVGRAPGIPGGVEIVEILSASGQPLGRRIQETSAVMLMVVVRDIDDTLARLKALGAPVVTRGGGPVVINSGGLRSVVVQDPSGHFVELLQPRNPPPTQLGSGDIRNVRVRHVVANLDRAAALYGDALGIEVESRVPRSGFTSDPRVIDLLGVPRNTNWRYTTLNVPASRLPIELIEFKDSQRLFPNITVLDVPATGGADQLAEFKTPDIASPGATRIQLFVTDIDAAVAAFAEAGGTFVSTGGKPLDVPAANGTFKVATVRDPDGLFVVLIDSPAAP